MLISISTKLLPRYSVNITKYLIPSSAKDKRFLLALDISVHICAEPLFFGLWWGYQASKAHRAGRLEQSSAHTANFR